MNITESSSNFDNLEEMSVRDILVNINKEDTSVPKAVMRAMPQIEALIPEIVKQLKKGGRLFYIGAGTSGRLGILDASEIPPTFGVPHGVVIGLIAGGDGAIRRAVEYAEDDDEQAWKDLQEYQINHKDVVIGIAASGSTPYVVGGVKQATERGLVTGCITCNRNSRLAKSVTFPIEVIVGPEFVTGSTRMKAGTAQKLVLNMISTAAMIQMGRVKGNKMVDMQLSNNKLVDRGTRMLMEELSIGRAEAEQLLARHGSVRKVIEQIRRNARD
ncbi:N-acetylmuramic acid 6-phosphate etherase [Fulvivirga imtechensis AK7]|uniref:N-acetylmuramic acid 6-phosphate etherase n=1 Tax=Fulvivirga imtechensis AK7 TaxID=1237149 RepID=L8JGU1_9BACT|nr:N-acetylmuramic acid 6-phosphate etherase [Fulvivirga imtechensis]ELR68086.1 N-acetylmuramic acid 6-phosphate etherase [Fulvivirga imtechensis AK7]